MWTCSFLGLIPELSDLLYLSAGYLAQPGPGRAIMMIKNTDGNGAQ